jgi:hypothetical protein
MRGYSALRLPSRAQVPIGTVSSSWLIAGDDRHYGTNGAGALALESLFGLIRLKR